jgi:AcrR family transcriptional regulator
MTRTGSRGSARRTYRHGDLRRALLDAAIELAREGGPAAVVLREATRRAGVVPNAAYRHFASHGALVQAVRSAALATLARTMETELATINPVRRRAEFARASLRAVGRGYIRFAQDEPGLFRTAFGVPASAHEAGDAAKAGRGGLNPFELLGAALDLLVEAGLLPPERRPGAEYLAWSAVHGLAMLAIEGPLRRFSRAKIDAVAQRLLLMVERGL